MTNGQQARDAMVREQLLPRGIVDPRVLAAMRLVPREQFIPAASLKAAYADAPVAIACGQTISQPYIVALMAQAAAIMPADRVLEVGSGSGYAAAVSSRLGSHVWAVERHEALARLASSRLRTLGFHNVEVETRDGTLGWPESAPFNVILVSAGGPFVPPRLADQLAPGGRLVMPVGRNTGDQRLKRLTRTAAGQLVEDDLGRVSFVPLVGESGWAADITSP